MTARKVSITAVYGESQNWERTSTRGGKIACPDCGRTGYPGGRWIATHAEHVECPECSHTPTKRGLGAHRRVHRRAS